MKNLTQNMIAIVALLIMIALIFGLGYYQGKRNQPVQAKSTQRVYDTIVKTVNSEVVQGPAKMEPVPLPPTIDTLAVIADYYTRKNYEHTYRDNDLSITLKPVISTNKLDSLNFTYKILRPTTITTLNLKPQTAIYLGASAGSNVLAPAIDIALKDRWMIGASYNLVDNRPGMAAAQWHERIRIKLTYKLISW